MWFLQYPFLVIAISVLLTVSVSGHRIECDSYCSVSGHCFQCDSFRIRSLSLLLAWFLLYPFLAIAFSVVLTVSVVGRCFQCGSYCIPSWPLLSVWFLLDQLLGIAFNVILTVSMLVIAYSLVRIVSIPSHCMQYGSAFLVISYSLVLTISVSGHLLQFGSNCIHSRSLLIVWFYFISVSGHCLHFGTYCMFLAISNSGCSCSNSWALLLLFLSLLSWYHDGT